MPGRISSVCGGVRLVRNKLVLAKEAGRADPVVRQFLELGSGGNALVRVSYFGIVNISAGFAFILLHFFNSIYSAFRI